MYIPKFFEYIFKGFHDNMIVVEPKENINPDDYFKPMMSHKYNEEPDE